MKKDPAALIKKIVFGLIGALLSLLEFVAAVLVFNNLIGFQAVAVIDLVLMMILSFVLSKKYAHQEMVRSISLGAFYGALIYLVLIFLFKTLIFSLLSGITG